MCGGGGLNGNFNLNCYIKIQKPELVRCFSFYRFKASHWIGNILTFYLLLLTSRACVRATLFRWGLRAARTIRVFQRHCMATLNTQEFHRTNVASMGPSGAEPMFSHFVAPKTVYVVSNGTCSLCATYGTVCSDVKIDA